MVSEDSRKLDPVAVILACRMKQAAVEEQDITRFEFHQFGLPDQFGILRQLGPQKEVTIQAPPVQAQLMTARDHPQSAIAIPFFAQREPH